MPADITSAAGVVSDVALVAKAKAGDIAALNELVARHDDLLTHKANAFRRSPIPVSVLHAHAVKLLRDAIDRYDPKSGVRFRTFLESTIRLNRFATQYKNVARIPEYRALLVRRYLAAKQMLAADLDREPTAVEMGEYLGWSVADVARMEQAVSRRDLAASSMEFDQVSSVGDRFSETIDFIYYELTPQEQLVFDYSLGKHGKPKLKSVAEIAKRTGLTSDKVYAIKRDIARRVAKVR